MLVKPLAGYRNKRLYEITIPGAHDAGIYERAEINIQTQARNILQQAQDGCRFFDVRIATRQIAGGAHVRTAYHLKDTLVVTRKPSGSSHYQQLPFGGWGGELDDILKDAKTFVSDPANATEFLILKFSKSFDMNGIAERCLELLKGHHFEHKSGVFNEYQVKDLSSKVVTVFDDEKFLELAPNYQQDDRIIPIRNMYGKKGAVKAWSPTYPGMMYFGKFSSTDDVDNNAKKQKKNNLAGTATDRRCIGMMYWTTTAMKQDIRERNNRMWDEVHVKALRDTWNSGLSSSMQAQAGKKGGLLRRFRKQAPAVGQAYRDFFPNIVMIDFVTQARCEVVYSLNNIPPVTLGKLILAAEDDKDTVYAPDAAPKLKVPVRPTMPPNVGGVKAPALSDILAARNRLGK